MSSVSAAVRVLVGRILVQQNLSSIGHVELAVEEIFVLLVSMRDQTAEIALQMKEACERWESPETSVERGRTMLLEGKGKRRILSAKRWDS